MPSGNTCSAACIVREPCCSMLDGRYLVFWPALPTRTSPTTRYRSESRTSGTFAFDPRPNRIRRGSVDRNRLQDRPRKRLSSSVRRRHGLGRRTGQRSRCIPAKRPWDRIQAGQGLLGLSQCLIPPHGTPIRSNTQTTQAPAQEASASPNMGNSGSRSAALHSGGTAFLGRRGLALGVRWPHSARMARADSAETCAEPSVCLPTVHRANQDCRIAPA